MPHRAFNSSRLHTLTHWFACAAQAYGTSYNRKLLPSHNHTLASALLAADRSFGAAILTLVTASAAEYHLSLLLRSLDYVDPLLVHSTVVANLDQDAQAVCMAEHPGSLCLDYTTEEAVSIQGYVGNGLDNYKGYLRLGWFKVRNRSMSGLAMDQRAKSACLV